MKKATSSILTIVLTFGLFFVSPEKTYAAAPTDYVSCWDLDETSGTRVDANTTNSNDLTDTNTVLSSTTAKAGNSADFESANSEYLTITDANQVGLDIATTESWSYWVMFESDTDAVVIDKSAVGSLSYWLQSQAGTAERFTNSAETALDVTKTLNLHQWYHLVWTYNAGTVRLYVDGVFVNSASGGTSLTNSTAPFTIGRVNKYTSNYMDGLVDIPEIYNRVISDAEITALYNAGSGVACTGRSAGGGGSTGYTITSFFQ